MSKLFNFITKKDESVDGAICPCCCPDHTHRTHKNCALCGGSRHIWRSKNDPTMFRPYNGRIGASERQYINGVVRFPDGRRVVADKELNDGITTAVDMFANMLREEVASRPKVMYKFDEALQLKKKLDAVLPTQEDLATFEPPINELDEIIDLLEQFNDCYHWLVQYGDKSRILFTLIVRTGKNTVNLDGLAEYLLGLRTRMHSVTW